MQPFDPPAVHALLDSQWSDRLRGCALSFKGQLVPLDGVDRVEVPLDVLPFGVTPSPLVGEARDPEGYRTTGVPAGAAGLRSATEKGLDGAEAVAPPGPTAYTFAV